MKGSGSRFPPSVESDSNKSELVPPAGQRLRCHGSPTETGNGILFGSSESMKGKAPLGSGCLGHDWGSFLAIGTQ